MRCLSSGLRVLRATTATASRMRVSTALTASTSSSSSAAALLSLRPVLSSLLSRSLSAAAAKDAKDAKAGDKKDEKKKELTPEEKAARKAKNKAARVEKQAAKKAAREALIAATGVQPSFQAPHDLKKGYLGTRGHVDTERTIDIRRFEKKMSQMRWEYMQEYQEKKKKAEEDALRQRQAVMLSKAERFRRRLTERLEYEAQNRVFLEQKALERAKRERHSAHILHQRQTAERKRRAYQASFLRAEREAGKWVLDPAIPGAKPEEYFDARIRKDTFFDSAVAPQGFWPDYETDRLSSWEVPLRLDELESFQSVGQFGNSEPGKIPRHLLVRPTRERKSKYEPKPDASQTEAPEKKADKTDD